MEILKNEIIIIDDFVSASVQDEIENNFFASDGVPWYFNRTSVPIFDDENQLIEECEWQKRYVDNHPTVRDTEQLCHLFLGEEWSNWRYVVDPLIYSFPFPIKEFKRIKANLKHPIGYPLEHNIPHVDWLEDDWLDGTGFVGIYYVNDSDGSTILFEEHINSVDEVEREGWWASELNVEKKISPKKGTMIIFNASRIHAAAHPVEFSNRCLINFNFKIANG